MIASIFNLSRLPELFASSQLPWGGGSAAVSRVGAAALMNRLLSAVTQVDIPNLYDIRINHATQV